MHAMISTTDIASTAATAVAAAASVTSMRADGVEPASPKPPCDAMVAALTIEDKDIVERYDAEMNPERSGLCTALM